MILCLLAATLRLAAPFSDHMVLQRGTKVPVWGTSDAGASVEVSFAGQKKTAVADETGRWRIDLDPLPLCREGRGMSVVSGLEVRTVRDILVGEVWLCAGQSNMEVRMCGGSPHFRDRNGSMLAALTRKPLVRFVRTPSEKFDTRPWSEPATPLVWRPFTPENLRDPSFSAVASYFAMTVHGATDLPIGLVGLYRGATGIDSWTPFDGVPKKTKDREDCQPSVFWNTVVNFWTPFAAKGMLWYQGEHDAGDAGAYTAKLRLLYDGWRTRFENPDLRFYYVQLCSWGSDISRMQEAQACFADEEPNAAMVVINDIGNLSDIHPNDKEPVGRRLALHALRRDYGKEFGFETLQDCSPSFAGFSVTGSVAVVKVRNAQSLYLYNRDFSTTNGFELADADGRWHAANIVNLRQDKAWGTGKPIFYGSLVGPEIALKSDGVDFPVAVRYLHARPWTGNLYNEVNLPMGAFEAQLKDQDGVLRLAERGKVSAYKVVVPSSPSPTENYAAEELVAWIRRLTGVELVTVTNETPESAVYLNQEKADTALGDDGFELRAVRGNIFVSGGRRGVLYGVYELLERFGGIMWLDVDYTHVPRVDTFCIPANFTDRQVPSFPVGRHQSCSHGNTEKFQAFNARLRNTKTTVMEKFGGTAPVLDKTLGNSHTFLKLLPPARYFDAHPEYFSLVKGRRLKNQTQLCLTNPDVYRLVLDRLTDLIEANRQSNDSERRRTSVYTVGPDDWYNYCECENCAALDEREGTHAGSYIAFVNRLAQDLRKSYPNILLKASAYQYTRVPPKNLRVAPGVIVDVAPIECDYSKPLTESRYAENVSFRTNLVRWMSISHDLMVWDYMANWRATVSPQPNLRTLVENIKFFCRSGVTFLYEEGVSNYALGRSNEAQNFGALKGWLASKLMWNAELDGATLIRRFVEAYYGKAAPFVLQYIDLLESFPIDERKTPWKYAMTVQQLPFDENFYEKSLDLWQKARASVVGEDPKIVEHVDWGLLGIEYTMVDRYVQDGYWKPLILSRAVASQLDLRTFERHREMARRTILMLENHPGSMVSSHLNDTRLKGYVRALAQAECPSSRDVPSRGVLEDWALNFDDFPASPTISRIEDRDAGDGRALRVDQDDGGWILRCDLRPTVALEGGRRYCLRGRLRVEKSRSGDPAVVSVALRNRKSGQFVLRSDLPAQSVSSAYMWFDFGKWIANDEELSLVVDPHHSDVTIDCFEFLVSE